MVKTVSARPSSSGSQSSGYSALRQRLGVVPEEEDAPVPQLQERRHGVGGVEHRRRDRTFPGLAGVLRAVEVVVAERSARGHKELAVREFDDRRLAAAVVPAERLVVVEDAVGGDGVGDHHLVPGLAVVGGDRKRGALVAVDPSRAGEDPAAGLLQGLHWTEEVERSGGGVVGPNLHLAVRTVLGADAAQEAALLGRLDDGDVIVGPGTLGHFAEVARPAELRLPRKPAVAGREVDFARPAVHEVLPVVADLAVRHQHHLLVGVVGLHGNDARLVDRPVDGRVRGVQCRPDGSRCDSQREQVHFFLPSQRARSMTMQRATVSHQTALLFTT